MVMLVRLCIRKQYFGLRNSGRSPNVSCFKDLQEISNELFWLHTPIIVTEYVSKRDKISSLAAKMDSKRRRAYNFTDCLTGYRQKINNEEVNQMSQTLSENKPDYIRNKQYEENKSRNLNRSQGSIILAGHTLKQQHPFLADSCNITEESILDETSNLLIKPDLNKCIDLFQNAYESKECSFEEASNIAPEITCENINICDLNENKSERQNISKLQRSMSLDSLRTVINRELVRSKSDTLLKRLLKRDTNYNIKFNQISFSPEIAIKNCNEKIETVSSFNGPMTSPRKDNYIMENDNTQASNNISSKEDFDFLELNELLQSLKDPTSVKQTPMQHHLLKRLSIDCQNAPKRFTEKLLTIIEESVINDNSFQCSDISLHRFRKRLQEMSKLIEDETVPEWPSSPDGLTSTHVKGKSQEFIPKSLAFTTSCKNLCSTCIPSQCNIKNLNKLHRHKSENSLIKNLHDSTNTFESLEAYCKQLYPEEYKISSLKEETQFQSQSMDDIWNIYKNQMASLEETFDIYEEVQKAKTNSTDLANQNNIMSKMQNLEHKLMPRDKFDRTIMYEIAQKRQRCITTAKTLIDIDAEEKTMNKVCPKLVIDEPLVGASDETLIAVLARVKTYQDYLEKYKSYLLQKKFNKSYYQQENMQSEKVLNDNFDKCTLSHLSTNKETLQASKLSPNEMNTNLLSAERQPCKTDLRPRLFLTPGKLPVRNNSGYKSTGKYFSNLSPRLNKEKQSNMKFQAGKIYSQMGNYDHVVSPVGMYIKGAKPLKKNEPSKTNEMLFIPKEKQTIQSPRHLKMN